MEVLLEIGISKGAILFAGIAWLSLCVAFAYYISNKLTPDSPNHH